MHAKMQIVVPVLMAATDREVVLLGRKRLSRGPVTARCEKVQARAGILVVHEEVHWRRLGMRGDHHLDQDQTATVRLHDPKSMLSFLRAMSSKMPRRMMRRLDTPMSRARPSSARECGQKLDELVHVHY